MTAVDLLRFHRRWMVGPTAAGRTGRSIVHWRWHARRVWLRLLAAGGEGAGVGATELEGAGLVGVGVVGSSKQTARGRWQRGKGCG